MVPKKALWFGSVVAGVLSAAMAQATTVDVYNSADLVNPIGSIETIETAGTGASHYSYSSSSGHPSNVNLGPFNSNIWVHENTTTGEFSFGFIFGIDQNGTGIATPSNSASFQFRITDNLGNVFVSQSDDPGEAVESTTTPGAFSGTFTYANNTDGIMVSGITGTDWTIIINSVNFGNVTNWYAASGETSDFSDDLALTLGQEYRLTLASNNDGPSDDTVDGSSVPVPGTLFLMGLGLAGLAARRR